ncbi:MAG: Ig domain-containing protein [Bacteroidales bacterium]|nr:Ig domain-containing protein [Bacteroidales bacterium]
MKKIITIILAIVCLYTFNSCEKDNEETINKIEITEGEKLTMYVGQSKQLNIKHYPEHIKAPKYQLSSSNEKVASVSSNTIIAKTEGETTITVKTENGLEVKCQVQVKIIDISEIQIESENVELLIGSDTYLNFSVLPDDATYKNELTITSSDESIATAYNSGFIEAKKIGTCTITISSPDQKVSKVCTVNVVPIKVESLTINQTELTLERNEESELTVNCLPENATDKKIEWSTSDNNIVTIKNGAVKAIGIGECLITATSSNPEIKVECKVTVVPISVKSFSINPTSANLVIGTEGRIIANIEPTDADNKKIKWTSQNPTVASISGEGGIITIKGNSKGTSVIKAVSEDGGLEAVCNVTVSDVKDFLVSFNSGIMTYYSSNGVSNKMFCEIHNNSNIKVNAISVQVIDSSNMNAVSNEIDLENATLWSNGTLSYTLTGGIWSCQGTAIVKWKIAVDDTELVVYSTQNTSLNFRL